MNDDGLDAAIATGLHSVNLAHDMHGNVYGHFSHLHEALTAAVRDWLARPPFRDDAVTALIDEMDDGVSPECSAFAVRLRSALRPAVEAERKDRGIAEAVADYNRSTRSYRDLGWG